MRIIDKITIHTFEGITVYAVGNTVNDLLILEIEGRLDENGSRYFVCIDEEYKPIVEVRNVPVVVEYYEYQLLSR